MDNHTIESAVKSLTETMVPALYQLYNSFIEQGCSHQQAVDLASALIQSISAGSGKGDM